MRLSGSGNWFNSDLSTELRITSFESDWSELMPYTWMILTCFVVPEMSTIITMRQFKIDLLAYLRRLEEI